MLTAALLAAPLVAGCPHFYADGACAAPAGTELVTWGAAPLPVRWGPAWLPVTHEAVDGGTRTRFTVPAAPATLRVGDATLRVAVPLSCPVVKQVKPLQAKAQLEALEAAPPAADPRCAALRAGRRARVWLRTGEHAKAIDGLLASAAQAKAAGLYSAWRDDRLAAAFVTTWRTSELDRAEQILAELSDPRTGEGAYRVPYFRAQVAVQRGDQRAALPGLRASARWATRLDDQRGTDQAKHGLAVALRRIGRFAEADRLLTELAAEADGHLVRRAVVQRAINRLHWREVEPSAPDPWPAFEAALGARISGTASRQALALSAARAALAEGRLAKVRQLIAGDGLGSRLSRWKALIVAELAVREGAADAGAQLAEVLAAESPTSERAWLAWLARARLHAGVPKQALAAYAQAHRIVRAQRALVPAGQGRGALGAARRAGTLGEAELLAHVGQPRQALRVVRRAVTGWLADAATPVPAEVRAQYQQAVAELERLVAARRTTVGAELVRLDAELAAVRERADGLVAQALRAAPKLELPEPGPGALFVGFLADGDQALRVWATATAAGAEVRPARDAAALLDGLQPQLAAAQSVWLFVDQPLDHLELHAASLEGQPLGWGRPVVYGLDLPLRPAGHGGTVVVRDPQGDLDAARTLTWPEAQVLHQGQASRAAVLRALQGAGRLVYAGHGEAAGLDGWQSALLLAGHGRLRVSDLVLADQAPAEVVLAACESGGKASPQATLGMAQAFLSAGSQRVIGSTRVVADELAAALTDALVAEGGTVTVDAWGAAIAAVGREQPEADWPAFRLWARVPSDRAAPPGSLD